MPVPGPLEPKKVFIETIGTLTSASDLQHLMLAAATQGRALFNFKKTSGPAWTVAFIEDIGLAVSSHQTGKSFIIEPKTLIDLACEAGVEDRDDTRLIIVPGQEAHRV